MTATRSTRTLSSTCSSTSPPLPISLPLYHGINPNQNEGVDNLVVQTTSREPSSNRKRRRDDYGNVLDSQKEEKKKNGSVFNFMNNFLSRQDRKEKKIGLEERERFSKLEETFSAASSIKDSNGNIEEFSYDGIDIECPADPIDEEFLSKQNRIFTQQSPQKSKYGIEINIISDDDIPESTNFERGNEQEQDSIWREKDSAGKNDNPSKNISNWFFSVHGTDNSDYLSNERQRKRRSSSWSRKWNNVNFINFSKKETNEEIEHNYENLIEGVIGEANNGRNEKNDIDSPKAARKKERKTSGKAIKGNTAFTFSTDSIDENDSDGTDIDIEVPKVIHPRGGAGADKKENNQVFESKNNTGQHDGRGPFEVQPPLLSRHFMPLIELGRISVLKAVSGAKSITIPYDTEREQGMAKIGGRASPSNRRKKRKANKNNYRSKEHESTKVQKKEEQQQTNGIHFLDVLGSGPHPTIVLLHGVCSCAHDYDILIMALRPLCKRIIAIDLPGHGYSTMPKPIKKIIPKRKKRVNATHQFHSESTKTTILGENQDDENEVDVIYEEPSVDWLVDSVGQVLTQYLNKDNVGEIPKEKVILFGNSLGGFVSIKVALKYTQYIHGAFLASPAGAPMNDKQLDHVKSLFALHTHEAALSFVNRVKAHPERVPLFPLLKHIVAWSCRGRVSNPAISTIMSVASSGHLLSEKDLKMLKNKIPLYLLWGKEDQILPSSCLEFFTKNLEPQDIHQKRIEAEKEHCNSDAKLFEKFRKNSNNKHYVVIDNQPDMGHVPFLDNCSKLTTMIQEFMEEVQKETGEW